MAGNGKYRSILNTTGNIIVPNEKFLSKTIGKLDINALTEDISLNVCGAAVNSFSFMLYLINEYKCFKRIFFLEEKKIN